VIKFRCQCCAQKIAVNTEGADTVIACPNCAQNLVVPWESTPEFAEPQTVPVQLVRSDAAAHASAARIALAREMARLLGSRLVQMLWFQRQSLLHTQQAETQHVRELEQRLAQIQQKMENRIRNDQARIEQLELALRRREEENRELSRINLQLARRVRELEDAREPARVSLRDAGFLLRT